MDERLFAPLEVFEAGLKAHLLATRILHFDETGMRCEKKLHWVHVASSQNEIWANIRMVKLKQKIGGCFRAFRGGDVFCRIRSYISTARKQGWNIWDALADAIRGSPRLLAIDQGAALQAIAV